MKNKVVVVAMTKNFRLSYNVQIAAYGYYTFEHLNLTDDPSNARIVITTKKEMNGINHSNILVVDPNYTQNYLRSLIISKMKKKGTESICIIGIDPGKSIGVAIFYMGELFTTNLFLELNRLIRWIHKQLKLINYSQLVFKIGNGDKYWFNIVNNRINNEFKLLSNILIVDEYGTSIKNRGLRSIHEESAIMIACRK